jgi:glucosylceramidase
MTPFTVRRIQALAGLSALFFCLLPGMTRAQAAREKSLSLTEARVYTTASGTQLRLALTDTLRFADFGQPLETQPCVFVDPDHGFQTFLGIGGALTDAAAETFYKLPTAQQKEVLTAYYSRENGLGYTIGRTNINSCDFSSDMYVYVKEGDRSLSSFDIAHDRKYKIPLIKAANQAAGKALTFYVSPWSPPSWMKTNKEMLHGGHLLPEFYSTWADYYIRYIKALESEGIPVWGLTVQNEPMATQTWESCIYTAEEEANFIRTALGPALAKAGMSGKKLWAWDHNRDLAYQRAISVLGDPAVSKYLYGMAFHWYEGGQYANIGKVHQSFPEAHLMLSEACNYPFTWEHFNDWKWGENYGEAMINDFNSGAEAWTDWNILLDEKGGPNHVGNFCYAPIHADLRDGSLHYMNSYYYIGHFSRFIRPGARRIACSTNRPQLQATSFRNADGRIAVVVMNAGDAAMDYKLWVQGKAASAKALPHSIVTILF